MVIWEDHIVRVVDKKRVSCPLFEHVHVQIDNITLHYVLHAICNYICDFIFFYSFGKV